MNFANARAEALYHFRRHLEREIEAGVKPADVMWEILRTINEIKQEFMIEHDMPGVRYWHVPEDNSYWATMPGEKGRESQNHVSELVIELTRPEFLGRQKIYLGVGNNLI